MEKKKGIALVNKRGDIMENSHPPSKKEQAKKVEKPSLKKRHPIENGEEDLGKRRFPSRKKRCRLPLSETRPKQKTTI